MPKVGKKWATVHQYGKKRKRGKQAKQVSEPAAADSPSTSDASTRGLASIEHVAASSKKFRLFQEKTGEPLPSTSSAENDVNVIVNVPTLGQLFSPLQCEKCDKKGTYAVYEDSSSRMGSACRLYTKCTACGFTLSETVTSQKTGTVYTGYDINRRIVSVAAMNGIGFTQLQRFFGMLNMPPPMHLKTWQDYQKTLHGGARRAASTHLQEAADIIRSVYSEMNLGEPDDEGILNISVSFDGSWHKRGRTSHNGIATVIELFTGLVIDFVALSNYCHGCELGPEEDCAEYPAWQAQHRGQCQKTIDCSSQAMETEAAAILWNRSVDLYKFRYTEMLGDGDGKAHSRVQEMAVYGEGIEVQKIDCVNHVTKRMGTALRTLVEKRKAQGLPIGGRGKLTDQRIKQLTNYYGRAIKDNAGDLQAMENAVWASFFHTLSSDEDPHHERCPGGPESWCFFRRAEANNTAPRPHSKPLPRDIAQALVPIYKRLGDPHLLKRCLAGKTQNSNEGFHSMLWRVCPKERWAGRRTVDTALAVCVQRFNKGSSAHLDVLMELDIVGGELAQQCAEKEDIRRVKDATRKSSEQAKRRRKAIDAVHRDERERRQGVEGVQYAAGQF